MHGSHRLGGGQELVFVTRIDKNKITPRRSGNLRRAPRQVFWFLRGLPAVSGHRFRRSRRRRPPFVLLGRRRLARLVELGVIDLVEELHFGDGRLGDLLAVCEGRQLARKLHAVGLLVVAEKVFLGCVTAGSVRHAPRALHEQPALLVEE